jgi:hypothetical protein
MRQHESSLIRQGVIRRGAGKGQIWTTCSHADCADGSTGHLVSTDVMPALAQASADRHLAEHQRADSVS